MRDPATSSFNNSPRAPITLSRELGTQAPAVNCARNYRNENVCAGRSQAGCERGCEREPAGVGAAAFRVTVVAGVCAGRAVHG